MEVTALLAFLVSHEPTTEQRSNFPAISGKFIHGPVSSQDL